MSEIDREELRGLLEESTPGPWLYDNQSGKTDEFELFYQDLSYSNGPDIASFKGREADAQLICLAPTLAAAYLDLLERVEWRPIETTPKDGSAFLARFSKETLAREDYSHCAECAVVRFQHGSDSGDPQWEIYSLAGPFGVGLSASMFAGWLPLPQPVSEE